MALISPRIEHEEATRYGDLLAVSFPLDSACHTIEVPLGRTLDIVSQRELEVSISRWVRAYNLEMTCYRVGDRTAFN